jgi:hypothetical protein
MASGQTRNIAGIAPKKSAVPGKVPTGSTVGEIFSNLPDQKLWGYDGSTIFEYGAKSFLGLTGGTITGNTSIIGSLSATTFISGSTDLYNIFATSSSSWLLSGNTNGVEKYIGTNDNFALPFNINGVEAMRITNEGSTANRIFINSPTSIGGSNAGIQYSNASTANRAQIKLHSYFTGNSVAGVSTLTSRSGNIGVNNAVVNGQEYSKWTAQAGATTVGSAPIAGTWAFIANNVNSLTVTSDWRVQLTNSAGTLGDRVYLTSEGVLNVYNDIIPNTTSVYNLGSDTNKFKNAYLSGGLTANTISATTISGGTILSAGTDLYNIFLTTADGNDITRVQSGSNIITGGTGNLPTINLVSSPSIDGLTFSGTASGVALSATTFTANTATILGNSDTTELKIIANSAQTKALMLLLKSDGTELLRLHSNALENTFLGFSAGTNTTSGLFNTFLGSTAGTGNTTGGVNVFVGHQAGSVISGGASNTFVGAGAGKIKVSGDFNVYIGANSGGNTIAGDNNVYVGDWAGRFNYSGANNTYIGQASGYLSSGSSNVFLGAGAGVSVSGSNLLYIANTSTPNPLIWGNFSTGEVKINGSLTANTFTATTLSGGTILSGSTNLYQIFQPSAGILKQKNGSVTGSTFSGNPKKATVAFTTNFPDNNYAVTVTGEADRTWTIESKTLSGFTINANANLQFNSRNVFWMAGQIGESN